MPHSHVKDVTVQKQKRDLFYLYRTWVITMKASGVK